MACRDFRGDHEAHEAVNGVFHHDDAFKFAVPEQGDVQLQLRQRRAAGEVAKNGLRINRLLQLTRHAEAVF